MPSRTPTRWLAPLALLAVVVAVFVVWNGSTGGDSDSDQSSSTTSTAAKSKPKSRTSTTSTDETSDSTDTTATQTTPANGQKTYTVRPGDTLAAIAAQTGVSVEQLMELNPDLDPNSMSVGDKIKLVE